MWPVSFRPWRNARSRSACASGDVGVRKPITGIASCCARVASGHAAGPVLRGLDDFRVRVQENGVGSMDVSDYCQDHAVPLDLLSTPHTNRLAGSRSPDTAGL